MIMGLFVVCNAYLLKLTGDSCQGTYDSMLVSSLLYGGYFFLFVYFFYTNYLMKRPRLPEHSETKKRQ